MMDRYLYDRLNTILLDRDAWLAAHPVEYSPHGEARAYVIAVFREKYEVLYRKRVSREEFSTRTELWDDIAEEINFVLTFL